MKLRSSILHAVPCLLVILAGSLVQTVAHAREPSPAENAARTQALRKEEQRDWFGAGANWERAMLKADAAGEAERAIAHGERAVAAWRQSSGDRSRDGLAFALGVLSKIEVTRGHLVAGRERNLEALRVIDDRMVGACGWKPVAGEIPPPTAPRQLLEFWARSIHDTSLWLGLQGRSTEAAELLESADRTMRAASPDGAPHGFYHRKLISARASILKFLGFQERAIEDLRALNQVRPDGNGKELSQRVNVLYYASQYYGPNPEYLDGMRALQREVAASGPEPRELRRMVAKMAYAYGEAGVDVADLEDVIAEARAAGVELEAIYSQRDLAVLKRKMGRTDGVEQSFIDSLAAVRRLGVKRSEPTLYREYATFLAQENRFTESLSMFREALRMTRSFGWTQHLPELLIHLAEVQREVGDPRGLERTLAEFGELIAGGKLTPQREFLAHCGRAYVLLALGREADGKTAIGEANALADRVGLNEYQRQMLVSASEATPMQVTKDAQPREPSPQGIIDLQPMSVLAKAKPGEFARARFRISNSTDRTADGSVEFQGTRVSATMNEGDGVVSVLTDASGAESSELPARIAAGEDLIIEVEGVIGDGDEAIRIGWNEGGTTARATCHFQREHGVAITLAESTASNTSLARANPFYAVHLYHPIHPGAAGINFRVIPSHRCRVEVIDAHTGALLSVDAEGDGSFRSAGDTMTRDADQDGFPEFPAAAPGDPSAIEILIFPIAGSNAATGDTRVELQTRTDGEWTVAAHDILKRAVTDSSRLRFPPAR